MDRNREPQESELIDLGNASTVTRGIGGASFDGDNNLRVKTGLSDD